MLFGKLAPDGVLAVSRWYFEANPGEAARMLARAFDSLWAAGAAAPRDHLALFRMADLGGLPQADLGAAFGYFALIGLGFMFVEVGLLSSLNAFLGHPTLALAVRSWRAQRLHRAQRGVR